MGRKRALVSTHQGGRPQGEPAPPTPGSRTPSLQAARNAFLQFKRPGCGPVSPGPQDTHRATPGDAHSRLLHPQMGPCDLPGGGCSPLADLLWPHHSPQGQAPGTRVPRFVKLYLLAWFCGHCLTTPHETADPGGQRCASPVPGWLWALGRRFAKKRSSMCVVFAMVTLTGGAAGS